MHRRLEGNRTQHDGTRNQQQPDRRHNFLAQELRSSQQGQDVPPSYRESSDEPQSSRMMQRIRDIFPKKTEQSETRETSRLYGEGQTQWAAPAKKGIMAGITDSILRRKDDNSHPIHEMRKAREREEIIARGAQGLRAMRERLDGQDSQANESGEQG